MIITILHFENDAEGEKTAAVCVLIKNNRGKKLALYHLQKKLYSGRTVSGSLWLLPVRNRKDFAL